MQTGPMVNACFDEERFVALLDLAGFETAVDLTQRLDEDLTRVGLALNDAMARADTAVLQTQSHILLSIAGTIGATQVFDLAKRLNAMVRSADAASASARVAEILAEIRVALAEVIVRVRDTRSNLINAT